MKKSNVKELLVPTVVLFLICAVITALLAGTNTLTQDTIQNLTMEEENEARRKVLPEAEAFSEESGEEICYAGLAADKVTTVGYVFITEANGYGGKIRVMTGISLRNEGEETKVAGIEILEHDETPGLGANLENDSFKNQFMQAIANETGFALHSAEMGIDGLTGATISSKGVVEAVNKAIAEFHRKQEEAGAQ